MPAKGGNIRKGSLRADRKNVPLNKRLGIKKTSPIKAGGITKGDARLKIIQKNRTKLLDARDKLAQMAKSKDAREKLTKLREARATGPSSVNSSFTRPVGTNITMKKDRHGKISLTTNKSARNSVLAPPSLGLAVQRQLGLVGALPSVPHTSVMHRQVQRKAPLQQRQVTRGGVNKLLNIAYKLPLASHQLDGYPSDIAMQEEYVPTAPPVIRRTIHNDIVGELPPLPDFSYAPIENPGYPPSWGSSQTMPMESRRKKESSRSEYIDYDEPRISRQRVHSYIDLDAVEDTQPLKSVKQPLNAGIRARLDTAPTSSQSHGIFAKTKPKPIVSPGHRIVVSNLHSAVTQEDITELFADIGDLMVARLVRPGTAEVIYKNLADANKAVEVYHNRQLDGQPMKCMLVNKRPVNNPTAPAISKSTTSSSLRLNASSGTVKKPTAVSKSNKLVPDLSTIHKVLFNRT